MNIFSKLLVGAVSLGAAAIATNLLMKKKKNAQQEAFYANPYEQDADEQEGCSCGCCAASSQPGAPCTCAEQAEEPDAAPPQAVEQSLPPDEEALFQPPTA